MANIAIWGTQGNQAFSMPMVKLTPSLPNLQAYALAWSITEGALDYVPVAFDADGNIDAAGSVNVAVGEVYRVAGTQVLGARRTGWAPATGATQRTTFDTATVTLAQLAAVVKALLDDATTHGLIGS